MKTLGLTAVQQGVERLFKVLPAQLVKQINQQWLTLQSLVDQCQQYNHENGVSSASFHELISQLKRAALHTYVETVNKISALSDCGISRIVFLALVLSLWASLTPPLITL